MTTAFAFAVTHADRQARRGIMTTAHGTVDTPAFMPVGTQGAVKGVVHGQLEDLGAQIILANTYHLLIRPGDRLIGRFGGLHRFMAWPHSILTDSGGYQVFSLAARRIVDEDGVWFRSHVDGAEHRLTPESATDSQARLGSDIAMALDECLSYPSDRPEVDASTRRTLRWATRARNRFRTIAAADPGGSEGVDVTVTNRGQAQFGIVQGGVFPDLRRVSALETQAVGFEAYAIGGLSVGEPVDTMYDIVEMTAPWLPADRPRYLMGTGTPIDLIESVARGIDLFDCVLPTRNARNGQLFTSGGIVNIKNARYAEDADPPDAQCRCYTCRHFSRAYLRHLFKAGEMSSATLNTLHNLHFYLDTMRRIRDAIVLGSFEKLRQEIRSTFSRSSVD